MQLLQKPDHGGGTGTPTIGGNHIRFKGTPQVQDTNTQLNNQTGDNGNPRILTVFQNNSLFCD